MSLPTYHFEYAYGRHLARLHRRRRAYAPTSNTASQKTMRKSTDGFPFASYMGMGLRLAALRAAGAPLLWICSGRILQVCAYHTMVFNRLPVTVLNRLNDRRSEIFTEFRLKSSIKVFGVL